MGEQLTTTTAAELIGCTDSAVRHAIRKGRLRGKKLGRDWFVTRAAAEEYRDRSGPGRPRNGRK